jgi:ribosomal protein S18 acetylase RimI-like enzyme
MSHVMRPAEADDIAAIADIAEGSGMFGPEEVAFLHDLAASDLAAGDGDRLWFLALGPEGRPVGAGYLVPEAFQPDVRNLLFLAVLPGFRGTGAGRALVRHAADLSRAGGARLLLIETNSGVNFAPARALYGSEGFTVDGRVRDYYAPGEDKVIFRLSL